MIAYERLLPLCWILLLCQVALVGCGDRDKVEPYQIDKLRVLAIRASAPEVTTDEPLVVDALVVGAEGEVTYEWRLCPFAGPGFLGFPCFSDDIPEEDLAFIPEEILPCVMGETGDEAVFTPTVCSYETYAAFGEMASKEEEIPLELDPDKGLEMLLRLVATDESGRSVDTVKTLVVSASETPNTNPTIASLIVRDTKLDFEDDEGEPWLEDEPLSIPVNEAPVFAVTYEEAAAQPITEDKFGEPIDGVEELLFTWYVTSGELERDRTAPDLMDNEYRPAKNGAAGEQDLWVVVRDGRGGVHWIERQFLVTGAD